MTHDGIFQTQNSKPGSLRCYLWLETSHIIMCKKIIIKITHWVKNYPNLNFKFSNIYEINIYIFPPAVNNMRGSGIVFCCEINFFIGEKCHHHLTGKYLMFYFFLCYSILIWDCTLLLKKIHLRKVIYESVPNLLKNILFWLNKTVPIINDFIIECVIQFCL